MSRTETEAPSGELVRTSDSGWRELWLKEDWWAIWLGLGIVVIAYVAFANGSSIRWIAVTPARWSSPAQLGAHFAANIDRYAAQFIAWLAVFSLALGALGYKAREFIPAFILLYLVSVAVFAIVFTHNLEIALVHPPVGLNLYVLSTVSDAPIMEVIKGIIPFILLLLLVLGIITYVPILSLWLPDLVYGTHS